MKQHSSTQINRTFYAETMIFNIVFTDKTFKNLGFTD